MTRDDLRGLSQVVEVWKGGNRRGSEFFPFALDNQDADLDRGPTYTDIK